MLSREKYFFSKKISQLNKILPCVMINTKESYVECVLPTFNLTVIQKNIKKKHFYFNLAALYFTLRSVSGVKYSLVEAVQSNIIFGFNII